MTASAAIPDASLRSPAALFAVLAVHAAVAWVLPLVVLHPERLPEPLVVALLPEPPPPDVQARPLPMAEVPPAPPRRTPTPPPPTVQPEPEPQPQPPEPVTAAAPEPLPAPAPPAEIEPVPRPDPQPVLREAPPMMAAAPPQPQPAPVIQAPPPAAAEPAATQPLYSADYLRNPKPRYPLVSRRMGEEGLVTLRVYVTSAGEPRQVQLKESCGFPRLDQAAQEVVWNWRFVPARRGDSPVDAWVVVPIRFTLKG